MKNLNLVLIILVSIFSLNTSHAYANKEAEIQHLLSYVENSQCLFIRNGSKHKGPDAKAHIVKKYNYFKSRIDSAEDFIEYSATKSTMSGKKYKVRCDGKEYLTAQWLNDELKNYRDKTATSN
ncbi:MAG: DUF5329 domain-containing protein [Gammaproteobacteria bacterium]|jgi:hypothetical protein